jgi:hypothetical protein
MGNIILSIDSLPRVSYTKEMLDYHTYYLSVLITFNKENGLPNFSDSCMVIGKGTPIYILPIPIEPPKLFIGDSVICPGAKVSIKTDRQFAGASYVWNTPKGQYVTSTPEITIPNFSQQDNGLYFVSIEFMGCSSSESRPQYLGFDKGIYEIFVTV